MHAIQLILTQTVDPDAGLSALLCVSIKGLTYSISNDHGTLPFRNGFKQVFTPYDWKHEFNEKQENGINQGIQSASGESSEAETEAGAKDFASTADQASQNAGGGEDKGVENDEES